MIQGIRSFYRTAPEFLDDPSYSEISLGEYLEQGGFARSFIDYHLLPMRAAIWSTTAAEIKAYPAKSFIYFFMSHGLLTLSDPPQWRTVEGGSREYVRQSAREVLIEDDTGKIKAFDHVVLTTHADEAVELLEDCDERKGRLLEKWRYKQNWPVLHRDESLMPKRRRVWSSWNFFGNSGPGGENHLCVMYWMNHLQSLSTEDPLLLTLNPIREPEAGCIMREFVYAHPCFDTDALATQPHLWSLQGHQNAWYCGSYFGAGFHEDALQSDLAVGEQLGGVSRPWNVANMNDRLHLGETYRATAA